MMYGKGRQNRKPIAKKPNRPRRVTKPQSKPQPKPRTKKY